MYLVVYDKYRFLAMNSLFEKNILAGTAPFKMHRKILDKLNKLPIILGFVTEYQ